MTHPSRRRLIAALGTAPLGLPAALGLPTLARAQPKPLTIILTVPPGTSSDTLARTLGDRLRARLDRPVVVESKSGAGGLMAVQHLRQLDADGSALMMAPNSSVSLLPLLMSRATFDMEKDLLPIVDCAMAPMAFTVHPASGVASMVRNCPPKTSLTASTRKPWR